MSLTKDQQDRLFVLEKEGKDRQTEYHSRIGRDVITALSAVAIIIGFLINTHHVHYLQHPSIMKWVIYTVFVFFSVTFLLELMAIRVDAKYAGSFRAFQQATFQNIAAKKQEFDKKQKFWLKLLKQVQFVAEICAAIGALALVIFFLVLLNNIVLK